MERIRKPAQGVTNIIRFNWHFYALAFGMITVLLGMATWASKPYDWYLIVAATLMALPVLVSLLISFYVYDLSGLYTLAWLDFIPDDRPLTLVTINAGFDETSALLQAKFPHGQLHVFDFYDPALHTEVSIERARKAYPPYPGTQTISTSALPLPNQAADYVLLILAAHEIRQETERVRFFNELSRVLKPSGNIVVVEHLRDGFNFLAYTVGFLHFLSRKIWLNTFTKAGLSVAHTGKHTPFITIFILQKNGVAP